MEGFKKGIIFLSTLLIGLSSGVLAFAQSSQKLDKAGLSISPTTFEISANPGDKIKQKLRIYNTTNNSFSVKMEGEDFSAQGEEGRVVVKEREDQTYSLKRWVKFTPAEFTLVSGENKIVNFEINIPKNAEPGGKYGSVLATVTAILGLEQTGALTANKVGALVLLSVSGQVKEKISVKEFSAPTISDIGPIPFSIRLENTGTVHERPKGVITITNIFGKKVDEVIVPAQNIIPGAIRKITAQWQKKWLFGGRYQATLVGSYGSQNEPLNATLIFWAFPWKIGLAVLAVIILIIILLIRAHRKVEKAEEIIKKYETDHPEKKAKKMDI
jgi:hypothetical protein